MFFPADMTVEEIEQFDYEYNRIRDMEEGIGFWEINAELQIIAQEARDELVDTFE